jgi:hypothetical protein
LKKKVTRRDESIPHGILAIIFDGGQLVAVFYPFAATDYLMAEASSH